MTCILDVLLCLVLIALASRLIEHNADTFETKVICGLETWPGLKLALLPYLHLSACLAPQPGTSLSSTRHLTVAAAMCTWQNHYAVVTSLVSADSLAVLMGLWLHCVQCTCSCKQTHVGIHVQIIRLTGNVLTSCGANRRDYSIKRYTIKRAINARKSTFEFWFSTFYSNK